MRPENVPAAAALLAGYGPEFEAMEDQASDAVREIQRLVMSLS
jgi:hypothetical protein